MRVAIVNDLALAREVLKRVVLSVPGHSVAWMAVDGEDAIRHTIADHPDVILMDLVMPRLNGVEATQQIMKQSPCPIIVVTATIPGHYDQVIQAMRAGALDAVETPVLNSQGVIERGEPLLARLAKLSDASVGQTGTSWHPSTGRPVSKLDHPPLVLLAASTGGPDALATVLAALPREFPAAVLIAQHIAAEFAPSLADWLATHSRLPVRIAKQGDIPAAGTVLIAASNDHLEISPELKLRYTDIPGNNPYRPSADVLFASAGAVWPKIGAAVVLTGMGSDGANGLLRLRDLGWYTIAQDEATCVVYGMPRVAVEKRAATAVLPLNDIGTAIVAKMMNRPL